MTWVGASPFSLYEVGAGSLFGICRIFELFLTLWAFSYRGVSCFLFLMRVSYRECPFGRVDVINEFLCTLVNDYQRLCPGDAHLFAEPRERRAEFDEWGLLL